MDEFEAAIRTVCEPIFDKPLSEISFGQVLLRLFQTARRFNMEVQPQLVLLQKTLLNIEGLGRELNPDLDLWRTAKPFLEQWMHERIGPKAVLRNIQLKGPGWLEKLPDLPEMIYDTLQLARSTYLQQQTRDEQTKQLREELRITTRRLYFLVAAGLFLILAAGVAIPFSLRGAEDIDVPLLSWIFGVLGMGALLLAWPFRNNR